MFKIFGDVKEYFKSVMSEDHGSYSFMRFISLLTLTTILSVWAVKNIKSGEFVDFGSNSVMVIMAIIGGKVASKFIEDSRAVREREIDSPDSCDPSESNDDSGEP